MHRSERGQGEPVINARVNLGLQGEEEERMTGAREEEEGE